jgi:hypothetical protein
MARGTTRNVTIRQGTSEKYWYTLAAYLAVVILGVLYSAYTLTQFSGEGAQIMQGTVIGLVLVAVSLLGLGTYPAMFKDSAYVRSTSRWAPKWWYYIGGGFLTPVAVFFGASALASGAAAGALAVIVHAFSASTASAMYLYRRHQNLGVP